MAAPIESGAVPRRVWSATALLVLGRFWSVLCTLAALALLSRSLSGAEFGRLTFWLAILILLDGVVDFGTSTAALQRGAHDARALAAAVAAGRRIRAGASALGFLVVVGAAQLFGEDDLGWVALAAILPLTRVLELSAVAYQNEIAWGVPVATRAGAATVRLALVVLLWRAGSASFGPYIAVHAAGGALANVVLFLLVRRRAAPPDGPTSDAAGFLRAALPLAAAAICQQAYFYVDNLFVRALRGDVELGRYNAAVRILSFLLMVAAYASTAALPWLARRHRAGDLARATTRLALPLFLGACLTLGGLFPVAGDLLRVVFGADFEVAADSLRWLLAAAAVVYAGSVLLTAVIAAGRSTAVLAIAAGGLALNALGNLWLVPLRGGEGAAMATVATELLVTLASLHVLARAGQRPSGSVWAWLAGPVLFALSAWLLS